MNEIKTYEEALAVIGNQCGYILDSLERNIERVKNMNRSIINLIDYKELTEEEINKLSEAIDVFEARIAVLCQKIPTDLNYYKHCSWNIYNEKR